MNFLPATKLMLMESERKFLLTYSLGLASVKTKENLLKIINGQLKELLKFKYATIFLASGDRRSVDDFLSGPGSWPGGNPFCKQMDTGKLPGNNSLNNQPLLDSVNLVIFNFDGVLETGNVSAYLNDGGNKELIEGLVLKLYQEGTAIGHLVLVYESRTFFEKDHLEFIQLLANQLALVVSKIKTYQAVLELERESDILQSLNIDFAQIREKADLLNIIHHKLNHLFDFGHHWVATINDDEMTMTAFLQDTDSKARNHPKYQKVVRHKYPISDGIFNKVFLSKDPVVFDLDQLAARSDMPEYMQMLHESGIKKTVMTGLQVGSKTIGVWAICLVGNQQMDRQELQLVKSISNQLSIAVDQ
jgi:formate hydrogenlyase transcriptional activator